MKTKLTTFLRVVITTTSLVLLSSIGIVAVNDMLVHGINIETPPPVVK